MMARNRKFVAGLVAVLGIAGWYTFRPERIFINQTVNEAFGSVTGDATTLARGMFHGVHHDTKGAATVVRLGDGSRVLRLTDFATSNGPDVRVYLVAAPDAMDNGTVTDAGFVELAPLKGNIGDQQYPVPATIDLSKYRTVTIWCRRFGVNFGSAPLTAS
jgi:Electron transfer DM13